MIVGKSVRLRALEPSDVDRMLIFENNTEVWPVSGTLTPYSRYTLEQYYQNAQSDIYTSRQLRLAIDALSTEQVLSAGYVDLFDFDPRQRRAGIGILIGEPELRGKGLASEALRLMMQYAFSTLGLHQLYCHIDVNNQASLHLFQKAGSTVSGRMADWIHYDGQWIDVLVLQMIFRGSDL